MKRRAFSLAGAWAMEPTAFEALREAISRFPDQTSIEALGGKLGRLASVADDVPLYEVIDGVAVIPFRGVVTRELSLWGWLFGGDAVTTILAKAIEVSEADPAVTSRLIDIDSPGGSVGGVAVASDVLFAARRGKPIVAFAADLCASAAYWIGSQASKLYVGRTGNAGAIGAYCVARDSSRLYRNEGIETTVVRAGRLKGALTSGTHVSEADFAEVQRYVNAIAAEFVADVARGRGLSDAEAAALADGRSLTGQAAVDAGLADGVRTLADLISELRVEGAPVLPGIDVVVPSIPCNDTEAKASDNARTDVVAHAPAPKEAHMSDNGTPTVEGLANRFTALEAKFDQVIAGLAGQVNAVQADVTEMTTSADLAALLAQARADVKLTSGNEAWLEPSIRAAFKESPAAAKAFVGTLPVLGKGEGSLLDGTARVVVGTTPAAAAQASTSVRHRFDAYGPERWGRADAPEQLKAYGRKLQWIAQAEATSGARFKNSAEAFRAFDAAHK